MAIFQHTQSVLSSLSAKGLLFITIGFAFFAVILSILTIAFTTTILTDTQDIWKCAFDETTYYNTHTCTGANPLTKDNNTLKYNRSAVSLGPFTPFNYQLQLSFTLNKTKAQIDFEEENDGEYRHLTVPIHYEFVGAELLKNMPNINDVELKNKMNMTFNCDEKQCLPNDIIKQNIDNSFYYFIYQVDESFESHPYFRPQLTMITSHAYFTLFELSWRMVFIGISAIAMLIFMYCMRTTSIHKWLFEQRLTYVLLIMTIFFDNPLASLEYHFHHSFFAFISAVFQGASIAYLLFYILTIFDAFRKPIDNQSKSSFWCFFIFPRFALCLIIGIAVGSFIFVQKVLDIKYLFVSSSHVTLLGLASVSIIVLSVYLLWLTFSVIRTFTERRKLGEKSKRIVAFGFFHLLIIIFFFGVIAALLFGGYDSSGIYLSSIVYFNLYCFACSLLMVNKIDTEVVSKKKKKFEITTELVVDVYDDDDEIIMAEKQEEGKLVDEEDHDEQIIIQTEPTQQAVLDDNEIDL